MAGSQRALVLALKDRGKKSNASSLRSLVVDEERMRPGLWLGSLV